MVGIAAPSVLDIADDELALRVCGPTRHGQIVRLRSRKCTIGSGPRCTLRLRARGVQPLHCLILRGPEATVIRRYSADTRVNGRAFTDAPLTAGDRLSIGPIELEVVDADQLSQREARSAPQRPKSHSPSAPLDTDKRPQADADQVTAKQLARARTRRMIRALRSAKEEIAGLQREQTAFPRQKEALRRKEAALADKLEQQQTACQQQEEGLRQKENTLDERSEGLDRARAELESERQAFEQQLKGWESERTEAEQTLRRRQEELDALRADLEARQEALQKERQQWTSQQDETLDTLHDRAEAERESLNRSEELAERAQKLDNQEEEIRARQSELEARQSEIEARQEALQKERQQWNDQQGEALKKLHARANELDHRHAELDRAREDLERKRGQGDAQRAEAERELLERSEELAERAQELDAQEGDLRSRQSELEARQSEIEDRQTELDSRRVDLDSRQAELDARESEINEKWQRWQAERSAVGESRQQRSRSPDQAQELQYEQPAGGSPGSAEDVLRRMGIAPAFDDGEAEDPATPAEPRAGDATETSEPPQESETEEDESIDDYMSRLLDRVRQTAGPGSGPTRPGPSLGRPAPTPVPTQTPPEPTDPPSAATDPTDSPSPTPEPAVEPPESAGLSPRAVAPERSVDLSAMRDLANLSAQAAIDRHARRVLFTKSAGKLMVALVSLAAGTALLGIWWVKSPTVVPLYGGVASLAISFLFGGQYLLLGARLLLSTRGRADSSQENGNAEVHEKENEGAAP